MEFALIPFEKIGIWNPLCFSVSNETIRAKLQAAVIDRRHMVEWVPRLFGLIEIFYSGWLRAHLDTATKSLARPLLVGTTCWSSGLAARQRGSAALPHG